MTSLTVRRFLVIVVAIAFTLSLGAFAIPAVPVEAQSGSATVNFGTQYNYAVSGGSFTDAPVTGNKDWGSSVSGASVPLNNVNLNLASSTSFDNVNPTPVITGSYNYLWAVGTLSAGGSLYTRVGLNNSPVTYTPGFDASVKADKTTFTTNGTQTLTVSVTPRQAFPNGLGIGVNVPGGDQYANAIITSWKLAGGTSTTNGISTDGSNLNINIPSPTENITYTYTITIQLTLQSGVTQLEFMPGMGVTSQSIVAGSSTGKSVSNTTTGAGTWTW